mmetsp:Transcript_8898/g.16925  ORF Transcript_8898/g.16925 Transcript_8898/m.16925 type:complete len:370 (+) Transcript_8898:3-1112(+)
MLVVLIGCLVVCTRAENDGAPADAKDPTAGGEIDGTEAEKLNYYELLEVEADIDPKALKKKYRKMALKSHPDKVSDPEEKKVAEKKFMELANAYDILSDVVTRTRYDFLLTQGIIEYEDRDWTEFDFRQGLDGKDPKYKKRAKFYHNFRDAQQRFDEIQKESDIPLVFALVGALGVGFIPIAMHWRQKSLAKSKRAAGMRDAAKNQASYNREYEKELAKYKAQLEAEAEDEDEDEDAEPSSEGVSFPKPSKNRRHATEGEKAESASRLGTAAYQHRTQAESRAGSIGNDRGIERLARVPARTGVDLQKLADNLQAAQSRPQRELRLRVLGNERPTREEKLGQAPASHQDACVRVSVAPLLGWTRGRRLH